MMQRQARVRKRELLKVKLDLASFNLELVTEEPVKALSELRKILEMMRADEKVLYEEYAIQELRSTFSDQFIGNSRVLEAVRRLLRQENDYAVATARIAGTTTLDLDEGTSDVRIQRADVQRAVARMLQDVQTVAVKHGIVHIAGRVSDDDRLLLIDNIHKSMPTAQLRAFHSPSDPGNGPGRQGDVVIECVFFGDFPDEEKE